MKEDTVLNAENEVIQKAKIRSTPRQTATNGMFSEELTKTPERTEVYQLAKRRAMENLQKWISFRGCCNGLPRRYSSTVKQFSFSFIPLPVDPV